ncbi:hypothetical protein KIN20_003055 [Parelaphostrongylus tenuis]|uniref:Uncharacterized protein n=1 Tax=Parelaphostrongylus tenuis TaxID=148309 RepID=A0AAD5MF43_PARTN|nr:hypothetical protein KIN20_003055 [Parelaphostrongylus tenuis]
MEDNIALLFDQSGSEEVIFGRRQVSTVRRLIQQLQVRFAQPPRCQFGNMQPCAMLKQDETAATST